MILRIGFGVDVHRLAPGIPLYIGGIQIPSDIGAVGHSDADVLLHAICDAILGAANLRDIGYHFSDKDLSQSDVSITRCELLVARTGSMVLSSKVSSGRTTSVYAPVHICIAKVSQLVYDIKDAIELLKKKYGENLPSQISFATGPSRTADIEKTLVVGVHGPKEVYCFLIDA